MRQRYTQRELDEIRARTAPRAGWDFSRMADSRDPVPWDYEDVVRAHLDPASRVLDVGTGGGERLLALAPFFGGGIGVDRDLAMVAHAARSAAAVPNVRFVLGSAALESVAGEVDVILDRHAPFSLPAVAAHLAPGGAFITQQVGERNMAVVKSVLGQTSARPPVDPTAFAPAGLELVRFEEYDVRYAVEDIDSLVFWLGALDALHADLDGSAALDDVAVLNRVLDAGVVDGRFVTNEHRVLAVARAVRSTRPGPARD